ncbi:MAG TPA: hypothetical protein VKY92_28185 [Verrucomicrobiae bacterium]|jgi:hypothetical protein|nr:hypothetical protein [Verrucomicrobiae bacterium]
MPATWIDVADNAVKIGSGSLIAGFFAWLVARHASKSAIIKLRIEQRSQILLDVSSAYEGLFQAWLRLAGQIEGLAAGLSMAKERGAEDHPRVKELEAEQVELYTAFSDKFDQIFSSHAKLLLLGEDQAAPVGGVFAKTMSDALDEVAKAKSQTSRDQAIDAVESMRKTMFKELSLAFYRNS